MGLKSEEGTVYPGFGNPKLKLHWFLRLADVGSVSRPKSSTFEPLGSKHGGLETAATFLD